MQATTAIPRLSIRVPVWIISNLFSFETAIVLFLYAGRYKADPRFSWIPIDLTLFFFALSIVLGVWIILKEKIYRHGLNATFAGGLFILWGVATYAWTIGQGYASEKVIGLLTVNFWCIIASTIIIANNPQRIARFYIMLMAFGAWMSIESIRLYFSPQWSGFIGLNEGDYLGVGRAISAAATVGVAVWMFTQSFGIKKIVCTILVASYFFVLLIGGGKGPLIALAVSVLIPLALSVQIKDRRILAYRFTFAALFIILIAVAVIGYVIMTGGAVMTLDRIIGMFGAEDGGSSASSRLSYFSKSFEYWIQAPIFGQGVGSFPIFMFGMDIRSFPHNMFVEIMLEFGIVGFCLFLLFLYSVAHRITLDRLRNEPALLCAVMLTANMMFAAMVSGDLPDNRFVFVALGLLVMRPKSHLPTA